MKHSMEIPSFTVSYDLVAAEDHEISDEDVLYGELHASVLALNKIIADRHGVTEEVVLEHVIKFGKNAEDSLESKKG